MLVKAVGRGHIDGRTYEPGDQFDCPVEQLALVSSAPAHRRPHPDPGSMQALEPLSAEELSLIATAAATPAKHPHDPSLGAPRARASPPGMMGPIDEPDLWGPKHVGSSP